jgi:hypothetical protein
MKHTIKLLTVVITLAAILTLTGCPGPVTPDKPCTHEHTRTEVIEEATCSKDGLEQTICVDCEEVLEEQKLPIDPENHEYQGGYCETCEEYKFENHFTVRVYTSRDEFIADTYNFHSSLSSNNENNNPYDECKFSFESENPSMTVDTLIHKKLRYLNYSVIAFKKKGFPTPITSIENEEIINEIYSIYIEPTN